MRNPEYEQYLESGEWMDVKKAMSRRFFCVGCATKRALQLHHMIYPADIWQTRPEHCCWLCDRCHETLHRAPAKYIAIARTEGWTAMVIKAQREEEDGTLSIGTLIKSSCFLKSMGFSFSERSWLRSRMKEGARDEAVL